MRFSKLHFDMGTVVSSPEYGLGVVIQVIGEVPIENSLEKDIQYFVRWKNSGTAIEEHRFLTKVEVERPDKIDIDGGGKKPSETTSV